MESYSLMVRTIFIALIIFNATNALSQSTTFSKAVKQLFFGVDVSNKSPSLLDSLLSSPNLHYQGQRARQWNLNTTIRMNSSNARSTKHVFTFTESLLADLKIKKGEIELMLGETDSTKKIFDLSWRLALSNKTAAINCFNKLTKLFSKLATNKHFESDEQGGYIAEFYDRKQESIGVKDITLFLGNPVTGKTYEIFLWLGSNFMNE